MDTPTPITYEVMDVVASLASAIDGITEVSRPPAIVTVDDAAHCVALVDTLARLLAQMREWYTDVLVAEMPADEVETSVGWVVRTKRDPTVKWARQDARDAARPAIVKQVAVDPMTGEVHKPLEAAILRALAVYEEAFSVGDPKAAFRTRLGMDVDEFRTIIPNNGYKIEVRT
jgi:hypothetical protein